MTKAALVVYAGTDDSSDAGRVINAMVATKEFIEAGDEVKLVFDGAGTQWIPILESEEYEYHDLYTVVRDAVAVCGYCANAHGVENAVASAGLDRLTANDGHPSIRSLVADEYEIVTF
ncbi:hypothetical protein [Salinibaculum rarum]|uniref:hypothetical protein n=1 Tax=Salinibaculum rarum TaxID=3058903 RepID=UPI00265DC21E|nr:hypothetical protein [Salinibaculum sp. KK48]